MVTTFKPVQVYKTKASPKLEIIHHAPEKDIGGPPLLFIHGAFTGAWCWDENFLQWFADRGLHAYAVSLRGHGESEGHENLHSFGIDDYVEDVARAVATLPSPPVLIGHSMGGFIAQKYIINGDAAGMVLMASVPPSGLIGPAMTLAAIRPTLLWQIGAMQAHDEQYMTMEQVQAALFSDSVPVEVISKCMAKFQNESRRACMDMYGFDMPFAAPLTYAQVKVIGAGKDLLISTPHVYATAAMYGVAADIFPHLGHGIMLEPGWEEVTASILAWLQNKDIVPKS